MNCGIESNKIINLGSARFSKENTDLLEYIYHEEILEDKTFN